MPRFDDTILRAITDPALIAAQGRVLCFNDSASALFGGLGEGAPLPDALSVPEGGAALIVAGGSCWTCLVSPVRDASLFLLRPAPTCGISDAQLDGVVRRLREQMAQLMLSMQLLERSLPEQTAADRLAGANRALCQMLRLTDRLDLLHELSTAAFVYRPAPLDLAGLCRQTADVSSSLLEGAQIDLTYESPLSSLLVSGNADLLQKLILELIANAGRAAGRGGALRLTLARRGDRALLTLSGGGAQDGGRPLAEVLSGSAPSGRIPLAGEGSGVGLALVRHILTLHGGTLVMERQDGVSATVSLPTVKSTAPARVESPCTDYSGGLPPELTALADVLPPESFTSLEL